MFLPGYWSKKCEYFSLVTEKKVEIFHSILPEYSTEHDDGSSLSQIVKVIASCEFVCQHSRNALSPFYHGRVSHNNLRLVAGKPAGFLLPYFFTYKPSDFFSI